MESNRFDDYNFRILKPLTGDTLWALVTSLLISEGGSHSNSDYFPSTLGRLVTRVRLGSGG